MTAAAGAALRIAAERDVDVSAEQLRAVLADTAQCLRTVQQDAAWRTVAVSSGDVSAYTAGWVQAVALIQLSADEQDPAPGPCCTSHSATNCCDPDDCGPCCPACPTCPSVVTAAGGR